MLPLVNKTIITTHPLEEDDALINQLLAEGAHVIAFPMIQIVATPNSGQKENKFQTLDHIDHIIFTSKNGVNFFFEYAKQHDYDQLIRPDVHYYVIGKATADALKQHTNSSIYMSKGSTSTDFLGELQQLDLKGSVLLALGTLAPDVLFNGLSIKKECRLTRVNVYRTIPTKLKSKKINTMIDENRYDLITFTSPSAIEQFMKRMHQASIQPPFNIACIGTTTAHKAISLGIEPRLIASTPDKSVFVKEITHYLSTH